MKKSQLLALVGILCVVTILALTLTYQVHAQNPSFDPMNLSSGYSVQWAKFERTGKPQPFIPKNWRFVSVSQVKGDITCLWFQDPDGNVFMVRGTVFADTLALEGQLDRIDGK